MNGRKAKALRKASRQVATVEVKRALARQTAFEAWASGLEDHARKRGGHMKVGRIRSLGRRRFVCIVRLEDGPAKLRTS